MFTNNKKKFIFILVVFFLSLSFVFIFSEIFLRLLKYSYCPVKITKLGDKVLGLRNDWRPYHSFEDSYFQFDPDLIWRPKNNYKIFNSHGFRGPEIKAQRKPLDFYIFTIGDSNTLGPQASLGWVEYLEKFLQKDDPGLDIENAGVWGYSSFQCLGRFKEILEYKPDMVLISCCSNDALRVTIPDKEYLSSKRFFSSTAMWFKLCQLFFQMHDRVMMHNSQNKLFVPRVSLKEYEIYLNEIISIAKEKKIRIVLLTRPFIGSVPNELWWKNFAPAYNEATFEIAKKRGVKVIDVYSYFKDKQGLFSDEAHFNDAGHQLMAKIVYDHIKNYIPNIDLNENTSN